MLACSATPTAATRCVRPLATPCLLRVAHRWLAPGLLPERPNFGTIAQGRGGAPAHDGGLEQQRILEQQGFDAPERGSGMFQSLLDVVRSLAIDQGFHAADVYRHALQLPRREAFLSQVDQLDLLAPLFEPALGFARVGAFLVAKNLYDGRVHGRLRIALFSP